MLQETVYNTADRDPLAKAFYPRPQAADAAHYQVNRHSRLGGAVQIVNDLLVRQRVHFGDDPGWTPGSGMLGFAQNQLLQRQAHVGRGHNEGVPVIIGRIACHLVEQL
ncbi:hypothetical protein D3C73_1240820 [compost metagenome]